MKDCGICKVCEVNMKEILEKLQTGAIISNEESFMLAQSVARLLANNANEEACSAIIYIADNWGDIPGDTKELWGDIFETVGFYPYIQKLGLQNSDLG